MLLHYRLLEIAARYPARVAVTLDDRVLSFAELTFQSEALAARLVRAGVDLGDRVALVAEHEIEAIVAFWAILQVGGVVVQINPKIGDETLRSIVADCAPRALLTQKNYLVKARRNWAPNNCEIHITALDDVVVSSEGRGNSALVTCHSTNIRDDSSLAAIVYTSGSTGGPKGVCLSHRNLWTVAAAVIEDIGICPTDSYLMVVPLHYVHGLMQLLVHHLSGATIHLGRDFLLPNILVKKLIRTKTTGFSGVPFHFNCLIEQSTFLAEPLPDLRWLTVTGGQLSAEKILQIRRAKPNVEFIVAYGQTECAPRATALSPDRVDRKPNSVGAPIRGVEVLILDEQQKRVSNGEVGEIVVAGDNVMQGYWRKPEATQSVIDEYGRLHTGDIGHFDEEGDLFLLGRIDEMIKSAGERIFPHEIEHVLNGLDFVREVVVVGVPDARVGERVEAHLRLDAERANGQGIANIREACRLVCQGAMSSARAPKTFHFWLDYPRKVNGKIDKQRLIIGDGGETWP